MNVATEYTHAAIAVSQVPTLAHSALPNAPIQPDDQEGPLRRSLRRGIVLARRIVARANPKPAEGPIPAEG